MNNNISETEPTTLSKNDIKRAQKQMLDMIKNLEKEEKDIHSQTILNQTRQQNIRRSQHQLENKILGIDKNYMAVSTRLENVKENYDKDQKLLERLKVDETELISKIDISEDKLKGVMIQLTESKDELNRITAHQKDQDNERLLLLNRLKDLDQQKIQLKNQIETSEHNITKIVKQYQDISANLQLILRELEAMAHQQDDGKVNNSDRILVSKQAASLTRKQSHLKQQLNMTETRLQQLRSTLHNITTEIEQIHLLLPTLELSSSENQNVRDDLNRIVNNLKSTIRKLNADVSSQKRELGATQKAIMNTETRLSGLESLRHNLQIECDELQNNKRLLKDRMTDLHHGNETLSSRIRQDLLYLDALKKKIGRIQTEHDSLMSPQTSPNIKRKVIKSSPTSSLSMHAPMAQRTSSSAVTANVKCLIDKNREIPGKLTITSYLVIFEDDDGKNEHRFCVDIQDVAGIRHLNSPLVKPKRLSSGRERSKSIDADGDNSSPFSVEALCLLSLTSNYRNRFMFGTENKKHNVDIFGSDIKFGGSQIAIDNIVEAVLQALLYHENRLIKLRSSTNSQQLETLTEVNNNNNNDNNIKSETNNHQLVETEIIVENESSIVTSKLLQMILRATPRRLHLDKWKLVYSIETDGTSINTFYSKCSEYRCSLIIVEDSDHKAFGAFASSPWHDDPLYYGTGETFVYTIDKEADAIQVFHWSGKNSFFILSNMESIAFGGGDHFAFKLDSQFENGTSGACSTYNSPMLSSNEFFICHKFEVYIPITN